MVHRENSAEVGNPDVIAELIRSRRTINFFKPEPIPEIVIRDAVDVAKWAPNHKQTEPWHFHILGAQTISQVKTLIIELKSAGQAETVSASISKRLDAIPGWLVVSCPVSSDPVRQMEDYAACSCSVQNLMLYLWSAGIGMKWTTGAVIRDERFFKLLGLDKGESMIVGLFWYGYPEVITAQKRKAVAEIVSILD